jgi:RNA polymerase sigma factor (sigma-70 family)
MEPVTLSNLGPTGLDAGGRAVDGRGVDAAFDAIYREHANSVYRYAAMLVADPNDAADVASDAFERAYRAWSRGAEPAGPVLPWLLLITRRIAVDRWRRLRASLRPRVPTPTAPHPSGGVESRLWLEGVAAVLPSRQREVLLLRYLGDLSDEDIGSLMGLSASGVRSLVARAIAKLREHPEVWR